LVSGFGLGGGFCGGGDFKFEDFTGGKCELQKFFIVEVAECQPIRFVNNFLRKSD
jgi:hypothetical protein